MNIETANRFIALRKKNGYSQEELAEKIGISRQAVSKWERGESSPDTDNLIALSQLYQISLDELLYAQETEEQPETEIADTSTDFDETNYRNVIFQFQRNRLQKTALLFSVEFNIDNEKTIRVAPDSSAQEKLPVGVHTIRASIPFQGNESYVVTTQVDIKPDAEYEMTYSISSVSSAGMISVNETSADISSPKKRATTMTSGRKNHMVLFLIIFIAVMMLAVTAPYLSNKISFLWGSEKETVVTALNTPGVNAGMKITATKIEIIKPAYSGNEESAVAIYFKAENVSKEELYLYNGDSLTYIDNKMAEGISGDHELAFGKLASGKRVEGYVYYSIPKDAKKIEIKFEVEHEKLIAFSLEIPSDRITGSEAQTGIKTAGTTVKSTEVKTGKDVVVTALNTSGVNAGIKITATKIKIVKPVYSQKSAVAVYIEVENQTQENLFVTLPSAYVDGKTAELHHWVHGSRKACDRLSVSLHPGQCEKN